MKKEGQCEAIVVTGGFFCCLFNRNLIIMCQVKSHVCILSTSEIDLYKET